MTWSQQAWQAALPIYEQIIEMPFVRDLAAGTLTQERFRFYLGQDALYLDTYSRVLSHIASRLDDKEASEAFMRFALDGVMVEKYMHAGYLDGRMPSHDSISPSCMLYTGFLRSCGYEDVAVEAAAVLPCFWVYQQVGKTIAADCADGNPYRTWIDTYSDEGFERSTRLAIDICDRLAERAGESTRRAMTAAFVRAARLEYMFWHSAYQLESWPV